MKDITSRVWVDWALRIILAGAAGYVGMSLRDNSAKIADNTAQIAAFLEWKASLTEWNALTLQRMDRMENRMDKGKCAEDGK